MTDTACPDCTSAEQNPRWPLYRAGCIECQTRHLAHLPSHWTSRAAMRMMPSYVEALKAVFGDDYMAGHLRVKRWADRIEAQRLEAAA